MKQPQNKQQSSKVTIGLDLGDRKHRFCVLDGAGEIMEEGSVDNGRVALGGLSSRYPGALMVLEAGCHSPWVSRYLEEQGGRVLVANPRKLRAIYQNERKSDRRDAQMLARIGRTTLSDHNVVLRPVYTTSQYDNAVLPPVDTTSQYDNAVSPPVYTTSQYDNAVSLPVYTASQYDNAVSLPVYTASSYRNDPS